MSVHVVGKGGVFFCFYFLMSAAGLAKEKKVFKSVVSWASGPGRNLKTVL